MASLTVQIVTAVGVTAAAPVQITAWSGTGDTITLAQVGDRGVVAEITNGSGGSLDFRVSDPGVTPAGNTAANGYTALAVANSASARILITKNNVDPATGAVKIGASTSNAAFTVRLIRY